MEYDVKKRKIILSRELSKLDEFVIDFCKLLDEYVLVSGYVSILLGRTRATEDVDLLVPQMNFEDFKQLWAKINSSGFECINTSICEEAFDMLKNHGIRFFKKVPVPNIEFKIAKNELDKYSYQNKIKVVMGNNILFISPLELQIAYKLFLAADGIEEELESDKDIEDARHLYKVFKEKINKEELLIFANKLNVAGKLKLLE